MISSVKNKEEELELALQKWLSGVNCWISSLKRRKLMLVGVGTLCKCACGFLLFLFFPVWNMGAYSGLEDALSPLPASNRASVNILSAPKLLEILWLIVQCPWWSEGICFFWLLCWTRCKTALCVLWLLLSGYWVLLTLIFSGGAVRMKYGCSEFVSERYIRGWFCLLGTKCSFPLLWVEQRMSKHLAEHQVFVTS